MRETEVKDVSNPLVVKMENHFAWSGPLRRVTWDRAKVIMMKGKVIK